MNKRDKVKNFILTHKGEIIGIGVPAVIGIIALVSAFVTGSKTNHEMVSALPEVKYVAHNITPPKGIEFGRMLDFWQEAPQRKNAIVQDLKMSDIGRLGEYFAKESGLPSITMDTPIDVVLDIFDGDT